MLDKLMELIKGYSGDAVINNPDIPNEHNDAIVAEATNTVAGGLQNMVAGGGLQNIISMFSGGQQQPGGKGLLSNPIVNMMIGHFASKLMGKFGLNSNQASGVANDLIPNVLTGLVNKTNDPNNSTFTLDNLLHSLTGGQSTKVVEEQQTAGNTGFNFQNLISQFTGGGGGNQQSGGGGGILDIITKVTSGAQNAQQTQGGGGFMNLIQGFLK